MWIGSRQAKVSWQGGNKVGIRLLPPGITGEIEPLMSIRGTLLPDGKTLCTFISPGAQGRRRVPRMTQFHLCLSV